MNALVAQQHFFAIINEFVSSTLGGEAFCDKFTDLWMKRRDAQYGQRQSWPERYDLQLIQKFEQGEITTEAFVSAWSSLWGDLSGQCFDELVNRIHSACSSFNPTPVFGWEINEDILRQEVLNAEVQFKECQQRLGLPVHEL